MSEFHINAVKINSIEKHPNADTLSIARVFDYQVIIRTGDYHEGELCVYIPVDSIMPDIEQWQFLAPKDSDFFNGIPAKYRRVKAKKLRGIFSQGMLAKLPPVCDLMKANGWQEGDDLREIMGITKWESNEENVSTAGDCEKMPDGWSFVKYTDIEGLRRYPNVLIENEEEVIITEKIHGMCYRAVHDGSRLWVGSRTQIKKDASDSVWWNIARQMNFMAKLSEYPMIIFFGEAFGKVQDLNYDIKSGATFRCFDTFNVETMMYNDWDVTEKLCKHLDIPTVPVLHRGKWNVGLKSLAEGSSMLASHVREGFVVKPTIERYDHRVGRVILKHIGEGYYLR